MIGFLGYVVRSVFIGVLAVARGDDVKVELNGAKEADWRDVNTVRSTDLRGDFHSASIVLTLSRARSDPRAIIYVCANGVSRGKDFGQRYDFQPAE